MDRTRTPGSPHQAGYTVAEMMVVCAIAAIAAAMAWPSVAALLGGQDLERAAVDLLYDLRLARARAVVEGRRLRVCAAPGADGVPRWRLEREEGGAWVALGEARAVPRGALLSAAGGAEKVFNPDGTCSLGSLSLRGPRGELYRYTLTPATGRVRFYRGDREAARGA
jgi:prepilin-type N-terminal cleavage/methylation domain-containing protein